MLPYNSEPLEPACAELERWRSALDHRGALPRRWAGRLRRELEAEAVAASTSMEGVPVTVDEVRRILAGHPPRDVREEDRALVEGYRGAMSFVLRRADDAAFQWNRELVIALHDRILAGRFDEGAGRLRTEAPAFVVNRVSGDEVFRPPPGEDVAPLVDDVCARMEGGHAHAAVASAWVHVAIAAVHPFRDGNGRAGRVLSSLAMYRGGFQRPEFTSLEEWWGRHLEDYYAMFGCLGAAFDVDIDVTPFMQAHIDAQVKQVRALDLRERTQQRIWTALEEVAEDANLDRRVANALWDAFFGRDVTAGYYRSVADVSAATATKDLGSGVSAGLLRAEGHRRGRRYVAGDRLPTEVAAFLHVQAAGPPEVVRDVIVAELGRRLTGSSVQADPG